MIQRRSLSCCFELAGCGGSAQPSARNKKGPDADGGELGPAAWLGEASEARGISWAHRTRWPEGQCDAFLHFPASKLFQEQKKTCVLKAKGAHTAGPLSSEGGWEALEGLCSGGAGGEVTRAGPLSTVAPWPYRAVRWHLGSSGEDGANQAPCALWSWCRFEGCSCICCPQRAAADHHCPKCTLCPMHVGAGSQVRGRGRRLRGPCVLHMAAQGLGATPELWLHPPAPGASLSSICPALCIWLWHTGACSPPLWSLQGLHVQTPPAVERPGGPHAGTQGACEELSPGQGPPAGIRPWPRGQVRGTSLLPTCRPHFGWAGPCCFSSSSLV